MPTKSYHDLVAEARQRVAEISPRDAITLQGAGDGAVFIDVREPNEWNLGYIPGALRIARGVLEQQVEQVPRDARVVLYCSSGNRSLLAGDTLHAMGYTNVTSLARGFRGWVEEGGDVED